MRKLLLALAVLLAAIGLWHTRRKTAAVKLGLSAPAKAGDSPPYGAL